MVTAVTRRSRRSAACASERWAAAPSTTRRGERWPDAATAPRTDSLVLVLVDTHARVDVLKAARFSASEVPTRLLRPIRLTGPYRAAAAATAGDTLEASPTST